MPRRRSKINEKQKDGEEDPDEISLISWLNMYKAFIDDTADLLKDEISNITTRKITKNEAILKHEKRPETMRLSKNIVISFNDAISKAVKDLQIHGVQMSEELQKRFNLPEDWMQSTSTTVSIAGSEVGGPTARNRREMENRLGFLLSEERNRANVNVPDQTEDKESLKSADQNSDAAVAKATLSKDNEKDDSNDTSVTGSISSATQFDLFEQTQCGESLGHEEAKINDVAPASKQLSSKESGDLERLNHQEVDEDADMIPASDEENQVEGSGKDSQLKSPTSSKNVKYNTPIKKEKLKDDDTPRQSCEQTNSTKKKETPKRNSSVRTSPTQSAQSGTDSDGSGKTCIIPKKVSHSPNKSVDTIVVKKERKSEVSNSNEILNREKSPGKPEAGAELPRKCPESNESILKTEGDSLVKQNEKSHSKMGTDDFQEEATRPVNDSINDKVLNSDNVGEDIMNFLSPPSSFGRDLDESATVILAGSTAKTVTPTSLEKQKDTCNDEDKIDDLNNTNSNSKTSEISKNRENSNKRREELEIMKDILGSSSSSDSDELFGKKKMSKSPRKLDSKGKVGIVDKGQKSNSEQTVGKSWEDDPKLKCVVKVEIEKLPPTVEKSLAEEGYVRLKNFNKMKKCGLHELTQHKSSSDSDSSSSTASNDSLVALEKELKKLTKNSIIRTLKHTKKKREGGNHKRSPRKIKHKIRNQDEEELLSLSSDSSSTYHNNSEKNNLKGNMFNLTNDIASGSSSDEDIDPDSDEDIPKKSRPSRSNPSRAPDGKRKKYVQATITSSDSDSEKINRKAILGSDSDSDTNKKRTRRKKNSSDSDSDFVQVTKKRLLKQRKKGSDSDNNSVVTIRSDESDSDSDFIKSKNSNKRRRNSSSDTKSRKKKRRKRIVANDSDDSDKNESDDSDIEEIPQEGQEQTSSQKGRKKIRKIMSTKELAKTTKEAERDEEERRKRLAEKQKLFNGIHKAPESDKLERLVLDVDPDTKEPVLEVDQSIVRNLKPHQAEGIKFMYNACFESIDMIKQKKVPGGCILAHCMGLGKTLQSIAFVHTLLTNEICDIKTVLVICPLSTVNNWFQEFRRWTEDAEEIKIHKLYEAKNSVSSRIDYLKTWQKRGGVGLLHYDMFRRLADPKGKSKMKASLKTVINETLLDPGPDLVICDEGHLLKNCKSMLSLAVNNIRTHRRIVLTGTPLQNNLVEYHTMMNFVKPNLLGSLPEFTNRFVNPIKNGQHADSTEYDVKTMKRRAHVLHRKLEGCVQRCDYSILAPYLPPKYEYIIKIKLSEKQELLYKHYLKEVVASDPTEKRRNLLKYYAELVKVWSHPIALTMRRSNKNDDEDTSEGESLKDFIVDETTTTEVESGEEGSSDGPKAGGKGSKRRTRAQAGNDPDLDLQNADAELGQQGSDWWNAVFKSKAEMEDATLSGKLVILQEILKTCETIGDKVLVFSQYLTSLDIIEEFLDDWDQEAVKQEKDKDDAITFPLTSGPQQGRWRRNIEYFRIDGQTKVSDRQRDCDKFNKKSSLSKAKLFLISTRAGGLGINLYGANRVVIFDASWNPSQDMQSIFRVYRFGQDKPCYIYRLIAQGTMEEKILRRQITKLSLSSRVVDEHQIERHFKFDDVNEMYVYDEEDASEKDVVLAVPKDRLLADLLMSHREWIRGYDEFDSLLENKPDEGLTNEEKELAWEEYRIESERQRQFSNTPSGSAVNEAQTFLKVKTRLATNHPAATQEQLEQATRISMQVIEKIRSLMNFQYQSNPGNVNYVDYFINPLKVWLQQAVGPHPPAPPVSPGKSILPPLPQAFYSSNTITAPQYVPRPPVMRRLPVSNFVQQQQHPHPPQVANNFMNIASNTLTGLRN